jgi:hypothetical protein
MRTLLSLALASVVTAACANQQSASDNIAPEQVAEPTSKVVLISEVEWEQLNPARGDKSPQAGTLWGDRKGDRKGDIMPTGFLSRFMDGFSSPPHIHNTTYGVHLVYLHSIVEPPAIVLEDVHERVTLDWETEKRIELNEQFYASLREQYTIIIEEPAVDDNIAN